MRSAGGRKGRPLPRPARPPPAGFRPGRRTGATFPRVSDAPTIGSLAPDFAVVSTDKRLVRLDDFRGRWLVLFFFPKAFTPGCTRETHRFRDEHDAIVALGGAVVGVSVDDLTVQCDFARENGVDFPLLADSSQEMSRAYGVTRGFLPFNKRITFVIDGDAVVRARFHHEVQVARHIDDVLAFLRAQQAPSA
jgi:peroxiredoxin Q/BCP